MFDASCFALLVEDILEVVGAALKMFDASCFALLVEDNLEVARGHCGGKVTASFQGRCPSNL